MSHCTECNSRLMFSARKSGRGLCGPCRRRADGESTTAAEDARELGAFLAALAELL